MCSGSVGQYIGIVRATVTGSLASKFLLIGCGLVVLGKSNEIGVGVLT